MTFQDLSDKLNSTVQTVPNVVKVLSNAFADMEGAGGGVDYSTDEQDTGLKWIDGSAIYQKTFDVQSITLGSWVQIAHGISNLGTVIDFSGIIYRPADNWFTPLNYYADANSYILSEIGATNIEIKVNFASGTYKAYLTLKYTKATA